MLLAGLLIDLRPSLEQVEVEEFVPCLKRRWEIKHRRVNWAAANIHKTMLMAGTCVCQLACHTMSSTDVLLGRDMGTI